jgi:CRP-like cAMP-binding protein
VISSYPPAIRRQLLSKHFLISTMPERALDDLVKFTTVARFEPLRVIFSKGDRAEHYRRPREHEVTVPLPQHDLGSMVGGGRETINKQLTLWRSAGIVDTARGAIVIRNCDALRALVGCV